MHQCCKYISAVLTSHGIYSIYFLGTQLWCAQPLICSAQNIKGFTFYIAQQEVIIKTIKNEKKKFSLSSVTVNQICKTTNGTILKLYEEILIYKIAGCFGFHLGDIWLWRDQTLLCQYIAKTYLQSKMVITSNYQLPKPLKWGLQAPIWRSFHVIKDLCIFFQCRL